MASVMLETWLLTVVDAAAFSSSVESDEIPAVVELIVASKPWMVVRSPVTMERAASLWRFSTATVERGLATIELAKRPAKAKRLMNEVFILKLRLRSGFLGR